MRNYFLSNQPESFWVPIEIADIMNINDSDKVERLLIDSMIVEENNILSMEDVYSNISNIIVKDIANILQQISLLDFLDTDTNKFYGSKFDCYPITDIKSGFDFEESSVILKQDKEQMDFLIKSDYLRELSHEDPYYYYDDLVLATIYINIDYMMGYFQTISVTDFYIRMNADINT